MGLFKRRKTEQDTRRRAHQPGRSAPFTYYQSRNEGSAGAKNTVEQRVTSQKTRLRHIPTFVATVIIVLCLAYAMTLTTNPKIVIVNQQNEAVSSFLRPEEVYQSAATTVLSSSLLNKAKPTLNTDAVAAKLQEQFPEATDIAVTIPLLGRRPVVYMRIAEPIILLNSPSGSYVIDEKGRAIVLLRDAPNAQALSLVTVDDQTGLDIQTGQQALSQNDVVFIQALRQQFEASGLKVESMTLPPLAHELHVRIKDVPYAIKFNLVGDPREQAGTYLAVKQKLEQDKVTPAEYIDVRVPERAYYK